MTRRALLTLIGIGTAGLWLAGCERLGAAPPSPTRQPASAVSGAGSVSTVSVPASGSSAATPAGSQASGATVSGVRLPTYIPIQGPKPDLPGTPDGLASRVVCH